MLSVIDNNFNNKFLLPNNKSSSSNSSSSTITTNTNVNSQNILQISQCSYSESIFSYIVLNVDNYVYTLNNATKEYCADMIKIIIENIENIGDQLIESNNDINQDQHPMSIESSSSPSNYSLKRKLENNYDSYSSDTKIQKQEGGFINEECANNLIWCLEYGIPDSLHDFGKSRNNIFPSNGKFSAFSFLDKAESFLKNLYMIKYPGQNVQNVDKLYSYYSSSPGTFEPNIKNNFLLGNICDQVENVFYFFTENEELPNTKDWVQLRKDFYQQNTPLQLNNFFYKLKDQDYKYCILDACMTIQKESEWMTNITLLKSLCNLWDPAGAGSYPAKDLTDGDESLGLKLVKQFAYENYFIFDSQERTTNSSLYDVYDKLLNNFCLEKDNITFKLRVGTIKDGLDKYINNEILDMEFLKREQSDKSFQLFLLTFIGNNKTPTIFPIQSGGFSVKVLSYGLYFIENNSDYLNINPKLQKDYASLKNIISFVNETLGSNNDNKNKLYTLITRFKSSGDHGSALSSQFINKVLNKPTLYLSGDQLAYVYSILINNPTIFRYYNSSNNSSNEEEDEEEDDDNATCKRIHFIGALLPQKDEKITCTNKLNEFQIFFEKNIFSTNEIIQAIQSLQEFQMYITKENEYLLNIKYKLFQQEDPIQINNIIKSNNEKIQKLINNIYSNMKLINNEIEGPQFESNLPIIKNIFKQLNEITNNIYFITNYIKAKEIIENVFKLQVAELNKIINVNVEDIVQNVSAQSNVRVSSRNPETKLNIQFSWLNNVYNKLKLKLNSSTFVDELKKTPSYDSEKSNSAYEDIIKVKKKYLGKITDISESMKEQFGSSSLIMITESKTILNKYTSSIKEKLSKNTNSSQPSLSNLISELFFGTIEPVVAIPINEEDALELENEIADETINNKQKLSKQTNKGIISNTAKKVISAISGTKDLILRRIVTAKKRGGYSKKRKNKKNKKTLVKRIKKYNKKTIKKHYRKKRNTRR